MATFDNIGLQEPSTISAVVATVVMARGSTNEQQEIQCLGDPETSNAIARVLNSAPSSTDWGLAVREVAPITTLRVTQSTAADLNVTVAGYVAPSTTVAVSTGSVRVHQSTAADLNVTVAGYVAPSTTVAVSSLGGAVIVRSSAADFAATVTPAAGSTWSVRPLQSSAADLQVTATIATGWDSTFASGAKASSGDTTIFSSAASTRFAVTSYAFTIDSTTPTLVRLLSGSTLEMARWQFRAPSSIAVGANLSVSMPAYLYRTVAGAALVLNTDSTATLHYAIGAYRMS